MTSFFYYSGIVFWAIISPAILFCVCFVGTYWWNKVFLPSAGNLLFILFGVRSYSSVWYYNKACRDMTYYDLWCSLSGWQYRYFTRGDGRKHFGRCAIWRLVREARKESKRVRPDG